MSLNQCQFIGNLGRDPESRTFQNGDKVCNLRIAVSETWKDRNTGERKEKTEWVSVAIFGPLSGIAEQYLRKGSKVFISGKMQTRKWQDQSGQDRYSTEVVLQGPQAMMQMLDGKRDDQGPQDNYTGTSYDNAIGSNANAPDAHGGYGSGGNPNAGRDIDDEIPFAPVWQV